MSVFVKVGVEIGALYTEHEVPIIKQGIYLNQRNVDLTLRELTVKMFKGVFIPTKVEVLDEKNFVLKVKLEKPSSITHRHLYVGGLELRMLDHWAYGEKFLELAETVDCYFDDGTSFFVHRRKGLTGVALQNEISTRISRAVMSIRPEWGKKFTITKQGNRYRVHSKLLSLLDLASRDIELTRPAIYKILGKNNSERFFLERSNALLGTVDNGYPYAPYRDSIDDFILAGLEDVTEMDCLKVKAVLNNQVSTKSNSSKIVLNSNELSYGAIVAPRTAALDRLLERPFIYPCDVLAMYGRYLSINGGSNAQYTHTPKVVADYLHAEWNVNYEGYSSPFNAMHTTFSSMYYDLDGLFGSVGPFCADRIVQFQNVNQSINPPFTSFFYKLTKESIEDAFERVENKDLLIFCKQPNWYDEESIEWFKSPEKNKYLVDFAIIPMGKFFFERLSGAYLFRLTGGLLFSVLSPSGTKNSKFGPKDMQKILEFYERATPAQIRETEFETRPYLDKYRVKTMLLEGESLESIKKKIKSGEYLTKMSMGELDKLALALA